MVYVDGLILIYKTYFHFFTQKRSTRYGDDFVNLSQTLCIGCCYVMCAIQQLVLALGVSTLFHVIYISCYFIIFHLLSSKESAFYRT